MRQIGGGRHLRAAAPHLGAQPVSGERIEPLLQRVVERNFDEDVVGETDERVNVVAIPHLDRLDVRIRRKRHVQYRTYRA